MRFIFVDLDQWPPRADVVESIVVVSTYHGTRSVVVTYKPSMLVPRARFPACALLQVDRFGAAVASGGALTVVSSSTWRDLAHQWPCGVTASTLDPESSNRGSNPRKAFSFSPRSARPAGRHHGASLASSLPSSLRPNENSSNMKISGIFCACRNQIAQERPDACFQFPL